MLDMAEARISVQLLRHVANCVELTGRSCTPLLAEIGLQRDVLQDRDAEIPVRDFLSLFERAAEYVGNPHFGLQSGRLAGSDSLGPLSFLFLSAPTLGQAFQAFTRYLSAMQEETRFVFYEEDAWATFEYEILIPEVGARRQDAEYSIGTTYNLGCNYCGGHLPLEEVCFEHSQVGDYARYREFFGCDVFFEQPRNSVSFDASQLLVSGSSLNPELFPILIDHLQRKADSHPDPNDIAAQVEAWLISVDLSASPSLPDAAKALGVSIPVIQRRLQERGTSWRTLLQQRRIDIARRLLTESQRSIADVAVSIGYAESASFVRAFKAETGTTPARYRKEQRSR